jgi:hypothetical protein
VHWHREDFSSHFIRGVDLQVRRDVLVNAPEVGGKLSSKCHSLLPSGAVLSFIVRYQLTVRQVKVQPRHPSSSFDIIKRRLHGACVAKAAIAACCIGGPWPGRGAFSLRIVSGTPDESLVQE